MVVGQRGSWEEKAIPLALRRVSLETRSAVLRVLAVAKERPQEEAAAPFVLHTVLHTVRATGHTAADTAAIAIDCRG